MPFSKIPSGFKKGTANQVIYRAAILYRQGSTCYYEGCIYRQGSTRYYEGCIYGNQKMRVNIFVGIWILSMSQNRPKQKKTLHMATFLKLHLKCSLKMLLVYTLDIGHRNRYRPDLLQFSFLWKENLRSRRGPTRRATVHRTIAFNSSNLSVLDFSKKKKHTKWCAFLFGGTGHF